MPISFPSLLLELKAFENQIEYSSARAFKLNGLLNDLLPGLENVDFRLTDISAEASSSFSV